MKSLPVKIDDLLRHENGVRALARELVGHGDAADDLVQETWLTALQQGEAARDLGSWLRGVVRNLARLNARGEGRRRVRERKVAGTRAVPPVDEILEREAMRRRLSEAVCRLDEPARSTLLLRYFEDLPPRTVAARMQVPVETVRTRVKRALAKLRTELQLANEQGSDGRRSVLALVALGSSKPTITALSSPMIKGAFVASSTGSKTALVAAVVVLLIPLGWWMLRDAGDGESSDALLVNSQTAGAESQPERKDHKPELPISSKPFSPTPTSQAPMAAPVTTQGGRIELLVLSDATGEPVAGRRVQLLALGEGDLAKRSVWKVTDVHGLAQFDGVSAGLGWISTELGGSTGAKIKNGETSKVTLRLKHGFNLYGRVVDSDGRPVAKASVLLGGVGVVDIARPVTQTDAQGSFELLEIVANQSIFVSAFAKGFAPSNTRIIKPTGRNRIEVELALPGPGGQLRGLIRSRSDQEPIFGANVLFAEKPNIPFKSTDGREALPPSPRRAYSDRMGQFRLDGLASGKEALHIRATGWAPYFGEAVIEAGGDTNLVLELDRGFSIKGIARFSTNEPAAGAEITSMCNGHSCGMPVTCGKDGSFLLKNLPLDAVLVRASKSGAGVASQVFAGREGETLRWNPILEKGGIIHGWVVDENDQPQSGWHIEGMAVFEGELSWVNATSDKQGRFTLSSCKETSYRLSAESPESLRSVNKNQVIVESVRPGGDLVTIRVKLLPPADAWIEGRLALLSGDIPTEARMKVRSATGWTQGWPLDAETGRFRLGPLSPASCVLIFSAPGFPDLPIAVDSIESHEIRDLGLIQLKPGGTIRATLVDVPSNVMTSEVFLSVRPINQKKLPPTQVKLRDLIATSPPLLPGDYALEVTGPKIKPLIINLEVIAGETVLTDVRLEERKP